MPQFSTMMQLPVGLALGAISVIAPSLLRPFVIVALVLAGAQAALIYQTGGAGALEVAFSWLIALLHEATVILVGLGLGRLATSVLVGSR